MPREFDPAEMAAAKIEVREALVRRYAEDGRSPAEIFGVMTRLLCELLGEAIGSGGRDRAHRAHLSDLMHVQIADMAEKMAKAIGKA